MPRWDGNRADLDDLPRFPIARDYQTLRLPKGKSEVRLNEDGSWTARTEDGTLVRATLAANVTPSAVDDLPTAEERARLLAEGWEDPELGREYERVLDQCRADGLPDPLPLKYSRLEKQLRNLEEKRIAATFGVPDKPIDAQFEPMKPSIGELAAQLRAIVNPKTADEPVPGLGAGPQWSKSPLESIRDAKLEKIEDDPMFARKARGAFITTDDWPDLPKVRPVPKPGAARTQVNLPPAGKLDNRRLAILEISAELLATLFTAGEHSYRVVENAVPEDVEIVGAEYSTIMDTFRLCLRHSSFGYVDEAAIPPNLPSPVVEMAGAEPSRGRRESPTKRVLRGSDSINDTWATGGR